MPAPLRLACALLVLGGLRADSLLKETERQRAPGFELPGADGKIVKLSDYAGRVVLVNFWATWCIPCKEEIPWLIEFERTYKERGFAVIGIDRDDTGFAVARPYLEKMGINYQVVAGDARTVYQYGDVDALPATFLIDRQGRVAAMHFGLLNRKKTEEEIKKLLAAGAN